MPFYEALFPRAYLLRHPERRGKDVETTRRSCEKVSPASTTIVNFVEGSRFTQEKTSANALHFLKLVATKAAGIAIALNVLGKQFDNTYITLCYPDNNRQPFFDMLSGKLTRIVVHVDLQPIADELHGDYQ